MNTTATEQKKQSRLPLVSALPVAEFLLVCVFSATISAVHLYLFNGPNLTLLFDGFGFLTTASSCMSTFSSEMFGQMVSYCFSGFSENTRAHLLEQLQPALGIVRSGPLLPILLGAAYTLAGKAALPQHWAVATWSMWLTQSLTIGLIWLAARIAFSKSVARIASAIALLYPAFIINGNRIASETQACLAVIVVTAIFIFYAKDEFRPANKLFNGFLCGLALGFLTLARPPFLLLPILLVVAVAVLAIKLKVEHPFKPRWIVGVVCGATLLLAPWAVCNKVLTGKPSILIDRYGTYNIYTGLNTKFLGYDVLPGEYIEHPDRFKIPLNEIFKENVSAAKEDPADCFAMLVQKPARLLDSPWNDYQISCLGMPWLVQRYLHQLMLAFAFVGLFVLWNLGLKEKSLSRLATALTLTLIVSYSLVHVLFITMARYAYPIMPVAILLSALGVWNVFTANRRGLIIGVILLTPVLSLIIESFSVPPSPVLPRLALQFGPDLFVGLFAALEAVCFLVFASCVIHQFSSHKKLSLAASGLSILIALQIMFVSDYGLRQLTYPLQANNQEGSLEVSVPIENSKPNSSWFIVIDPVLNGFSLDAIKSCRVAINGTELTGDLYPLIGADSSQRDSYVYVKAFSHAGQKDLTGIQQWYCTSVPPNLVKTGDNSIQFWQESDTNEPTFVRCDLLDSERKSSSVSLINFSWTKGFTVNPPLDMRFAEWRGPEPTFADGNVRPRISLLEVEDGKPYLQSVGVKQQVMFPSVTLSKKGDKVVSLPVSPEKLQPLVDAIKNGMGNAVRFEVSGNAIGSGPASVAMITNSGAKESMAALAPEQIYSSAQGKSFSFVDFVPANISNGDYSLSTRLLVAAKPWWDVLQYGSYKVSQPVTVNNLTVEASVANLPNLSKQKFQRFDCRPIKRP